MTDEQARKEARTLLIGILDNPESPIINVNPQRWDEQLNVIIRALATRERAVWEVVATHIVESEDDFTSFKSMGGPIPCVEFDVVKFAEWCRQQAQVVKPGQIPTPEEG